MKNVWLVMVSLVALVAASCGKGCPPYVCRSMLRVTLTSGDLALFDEGDTDVQICIDGPCFDFKIVAGQRAALTADDSAQVTLQRETSTLWFESDTFHGEKARDVKLTILRDTIERSTHTWPSTPFNFIGGKSGACASSCVSAIVSE